MANRPANAGANRAGPQQGPAAAPPPVHHQDFPRRSERRQRNRHAANAANAAHTAPAAPAAHPALVAWLPYLVVLAGAVTGLFVAWRGSQHAGQGAGLIGGALLAAAAARLVLPPRYSGLLASRGKALDVAAFAVLGAAVLGVAISLP
jgi:Protein of unknown function (DUF3017)